MSSVILETSTRALFHTILLFSLFLLFAGHNDPGGGFVGGLVAGAALVLRAVALGADDVVVTARVRPETLLGGGLLLAATTGAAALALGADFLESGSVEAEIPLLGTVKVVSVLFFDIGVYLVVVGLVLALLASLGRELDR